MRERAPKTLVTTSWDDGCPLDLRLAELLAACGIKGTFYVPVTCAGRPSLTASQIRSLDAMGMEIGSHTLTHPVLTSLAQNEVRNELRESRGRLEDLLGRPVTALCYPKGKFNRTVCSEATQAGYRVARTTVAFRTALQFDPARMPVSCQFARVSRTILLRHALRGRNLGGLLWWSTVGKLENDPLRLARLLFDHALSHGGVLHVWGHSWELENHNLWGPFEELLRYLARRPRVNYVTNGQLLPGTAPATCTSGSRFSAAPTKEETGE